jgi:poly(hydroxyalkanoate) granule-associated protein
MVTKRKSRRVVRKPKSTAPVRMMDAMNQVWLAGLGAMSKARQGAPLMLQELVAEGARVQSDTRDNAEKMLGGLMGDVRASIDSSVKQVRSQAGDALDNLEQMFQTRVHRALTQLGVPSAEDVEQLSHRVEQLNASINKLAAERRVVKTVARPRARTTRIAHKPGSLGTSRAAAP